jgi:hypothetical protein
MWYLKNKSKKDLTHLEDLSECVRSIKNNQNNKPKMKKTKPKTKTNKNELTKQGFWTLYNLWQQKNNSKKD